MQQDVIREIHYSQNSPGRGQHPHKQSKTQRAMSRQKKTSAVAW